MDCASFAWRAGVSDCLGGASTKALAVFLPSTGEAKDFSGKRIRIPTRAHQVRTGFAPPLLLLALADSASPPLHFTQVCYMIN